MLRLYKCRICGGTFERESSKGRKPLACPEHRREAKRQVDRDRKREIYANGRAPLPSCCVDAGNRQCRQHRQWKTFKATWHRITINPDTVQILDTFTEALGANGFHITSN
jgi:DNA-directed RNA polymerase subunit RPC12/RpoP